jgi:hypothetical protein
MFEESVLARATHLVQERDKRFDSRGARASDRGRRTGQRLVLRRVAALRLRAAPVSFRARPRATRASARPRSWSRRDPPLRAHRARGCWACHLTACCLRSSARLGASAHETQPWRSYSRRRAASRWCRPPASRSRTILDGLATRDALLTRIQEQGAVGLVNRPARKRQTSRAL